LLTVTSASDITLTVPTNTADPIPVRSEIHVLQTANGRALISGDVGVTVNGTPGTRTRTQWSMITIIKIATNSWVVVGDTTT
jgi:hypothetical protein